jgi:hypothetical protein
MVALHALHKTREVCLALAEENEAEAKVRIREAREFTQMAKTLRKRAGRLNALIAASF